jgi:uncharacterized protein YggE
MNLLMQKPSLRTKLLAVILLIALNVTAQDHTARPGDRPAHETRRGILVTGNAEVTAAPDQAIVRLGMTAQNSRATVAQSKVNEVIQKTIEALTKAGVNRRSIHTTHISVTPIYSDKILSPGGSKISAFRADNVLEITVDDIKSVGEVIDAAINSGANEVQGVSFRLKDDDAQRQKALTAASRDAKARAETIARTLGVTLGNLIEATESAAYFPRPSEPAAFMAMTSRKEYSPTPIEPGQLRLHATITLRYETLPRPSQ